MPYHQAPNFDIAIRGTDAPYTVTATYKGLTAEGYFDHDALQPDWVGTIRVLADTQTPSGEAFILNVGGLLFDALMQGSIRDLWVEARTGQESGQESGQHLRIRLNLHTPAVAALPWETLADPRRRRTLAADRALALVRTATDVEYVGRARPLQTQLPAKILIAAAEETDNIDAAAEIERIRTSLAPLIPGQIELDILSGRFGIQDLRRRLQESRPDILHIISHGQADGLYLWEDGELTLVRASQLAAALDLVDSVKLVFLNACLAGQTDASTPFAGLAQRILQTGIPAVIAMQFVVLDRVAADFAGFLYAALIDGPTPGAIDVAMSFARSALYISDPDRIDYATPLLWLNAPDGVILQLDDEPLPVEITAPSLVPPLPKLVLDIEEKEEWFKQLPSTIESREMRFDYPDRKKQVEADLNALRESQKIQQDGGTLDFQETTKQLKSFNKERRLTDNLLERLHRAER